MSPADTVDKPTLEAVKKGKSWLLWSGILMIIGAIAAIVWPVAATLAASLLVGWLFLFVGIARFINSFTYHGTGPFFGALLLSLLTIAAGAFMVFNPVSGALALTILVAVIFMIEGAFEVGLAFDLRPEPGWGWTLFSAVISILAGVLIAAGLPGTSLFVLGLLIGINFLSSGIASVMLSRAVGEAARAA